VSGFGALHLRAEIARVLESWGWDAEEAGVRDVVPTVARGHAVVQVTSPTPAAAAPLVAAALGRVGPEAPGLLLCPPEQLVEWGGLAHALAEGTGLRIEVAATPARALRRLRADALDLLVTSLDTAAALIAQSALKAERLALVLLAQPEAYAEHPSLAVLMQEIPKTAQRVIVTAEPAQAAGLVERYARRALVVGAPPAEAAPEPPAGSVRTVGVPWSRRVSALGDVLQVLDPARAVIWAVDRSHAAAIARAVPLDGEAVELVTAGEVPKADVVIAFDLPSRAQLASLLEAGEVVLLVPPGAEGYVARTAATQRPLRLPGLMEELVREAARDRAAVLAAIESADLRAGVAALAPLLERHDAVRVAAALYALWKGGGAASGTAPAAAAPTIAKVWVSIGKRDGVTPADLVGTLTKELRVSRESIGRIELKDSFSLIELPAGDAARIADGLSGKTIRRVKLAARLDREAGGGGGRPERGAPRGDRGDRGDRPAKRPPVRRSPRSE
jgi:ATP-dependent RNA helicase DeaD